MKRDCNLRSMIWDAGHDAILGYSRKISGFLPDDWIRILQRAKSLQLQLHVSTPLVVEYEAILKREIVTMAPKDIEAIVDYLCLVASKHEIFYLWRPLLKDANDDHVLELAVKAEAIIVTWNLRDFHAATSLGIEAVTPRELLKRLEDQS